MGQEDNMKRLDYIDYAKGIGILLVVLGHIYNNGTKVWICSFHMPLFFIISGYLLEYTKLYNKDFKGIFISKLKSLIIPFYVYSIINTFILLCLNNFSRDVLIENTIRIVTLQGKGGVWFLPCLFFAELIYIFLKKNIDNNMIINLTISFLFVISCFLPKNILALVIIARIFMALGFLRVGNVIVKNIEKYNLNTFFILLLFGISIIGALFNGGVDLFSLTLGKYKVLYVLLSIVGSIVIISLCKKLEKKNLRILKYFGVNSLIIMATHKSIINIINYFIGVYSDYIYGTIIFIVVTLSEIFIIYAVNRYLPFTIGKFKKREKVQAISG